LLTRCFLLAAFICGVVERRGKIVPVNFLDGVSGRCRLLLLWDERGDIFFTVADGGNAGRAVFERSFGLVCLC